VQLSFVLLQPTGSYLNGVLEVLWNVKWAMKSSLPFQGIKVDAQTLDDAL
jgi:hypothetical protein